MGDLACKKERRRPEHQSRHEHDHHRHEGRARAGGAGLRLRLEDPRGDHVKLRLFLGTEAVQVRCRQVAHFIFGEKPLESGIELRQTPSRFPQRRGNGWGDGAKRFRNRARFRHVAPRLERVLRTAGEFEGFEMIDRGIELGRQPECRAARLFRGLYHGMYRDLLREGGQVLGENAHLGGDLSLLLLGGDQAFERILVIPDAREDLLHRGTVVRPPREQRKDRPFALQHRGIAHAGDFGERHFAGPPIVKGGDSGLV